VSGADGVREQLAGAEGVAAVLAAGYGAFEWMLAVLEGYEDPAGEMFAAFVMAGGAAADGRDAVAFAPSLPAVPPWPPARGGPDGLGEAAEAGPGAQEAAAAVAGVCGLLAGRLQAGAAVAAVAGDRAACAEAARYATKVQWLLTGDGP
jgi:hypothetical protein